MDRTTKRLLHIIGGMVFALYLWTLSYYLFFAEGYGRSMEAGGELRYNLQLFAEIGRFWKYRNVLGYQAFLVNVVGNVVAFLPFGAFLPFLFGAHCKWYKTVIIGFMFSLIVETIQLVTRVGCFDVDDLFLNTAGVWSGYLLFAFANRIRRKKLHGKKI